MEIKQNGFQVFYDQDLDDEPVQFEIQSKGYLYGTILKINNENEFQINFYDSSRFKQDVDDELKMYSFFYEENVVLVEKITKEKLLSAINDVFLGGVYKKMIPVTQKEQKI
ncbi:hypothetical protein ACIQ57_21665 [Lysinibacillus xylanilyticus]|uniref:hypothetical protein n=1 Tax=Lysinibacillus xylanilyticus TaxID=582475 RepID=UPI00380DD464